MCRRVRSRQGTREGNPRESKWQEENVFKYGKNILKNYLAPVNQRNITIRQVANAKSKQRNLYYKVGCGKTLKNVHNVLQSLPQSSQQSCDLAAPPQSPLMAILATAGRLSGPGRNVAKWGTRGGARKARDGHWEVYIVHSTLHAAPRHVNAGDMHGKNTNASSQKLQYDRKCSVQSEGSIEELFTANCSGTWGQDWLKIPAFISLIRS